MLTNPAPLALTLDSLQSGQHSLTLYVEQMALRIRKVDDQVHAFLPEEGRMARLKAEARVLRQAYPDPRQRPTLFGALVGVKDIFHVQGYTTRAGSAIPPELFASDPPDGDALCVARLRAAGALIAGKTVTTEFAYFEPGPTRNPHNLMHTPGGSSSGSAAAVAAGLCTLALGTQTIGSVIRPAAFCGIVGFKPTYERIPSQGIVYFSRTVDHVGLFTQDVAGMGLAASVLCDGWRSLDGPTRLPLLAVPDGPYLDQVESEAYGAFETQIARLEAAGCRVKRVPFFDDIAFLNHLHRRLVFAEFAQEHAEIYARHADLYRPRTAEAIETGKTVGPEELAVARASCGRLRQELEEKMESEGVDLWVCPAAVGTAPLGIEATGDPNMNLPWTHAGVPAITLPAGLAANGLPLGLQLVARFGADEELLGWAAVIGAHLGKLNQGIG
ncbi:MAG: amidase [Caldilineaceae bacterium]|nr:amidase [Caldilineaceae bacterium]